MDALLSQFNILSDKALEDKNFDPATIEELMKLFELEAYNSWTDIEAEQRKAVEEAEISMKEAEDYLNSVMDGAMDEFRRVEEDLNRTSKTEYKNLVQVAKNAKKVGKSLETAATTASKKYMEAADLSATASLKTARKGFSNNPSKVHPS